MGHGTWRREDVGEEDLSKKAAPPGVTGKELQTRVDDVAQLGAYKGLGGGSSQK